MFTIRIDRADGVRDVYGCARYRVAPDPDRVQVELFEAGSEAVAQTLALAPGDRGFVMNADGNTVDQVHLSRRSHR